MGKHAATNLAESVQLESFRTLNGRPNIAVSCQLLSRDIYSKYVNLSMFSFPSNFSSINCLKEGHEEV